ncbi:hypothetical protein HMSSN139_13060 [Paenibacillus sp. HMSSN-139]|nr:hypothetical protein HMSSN139_13060 [Paenibacillus sp. HMSSN-139]
MEKQVNLRGYPLLIQHVEDGSDEINVAAQLVKEKNLQGVIFFGGPMITRQKNSNSYRFLSY